jgi:hypothetical protein
MHPLPETGRFMRFSLFWAHQGTTPHIRAELMRFWSRHGAIADPAAAWKRTFEVACLAVDDSGRIAGVTSVFIDRPEGAAAFWIYRMFIRPDCRVPGLGMAMAATTARELETRYGGEAGSPAGIWAAIENPKLLSRGGMRAMRRLGFGHAGQDRQGRQVWIKMSSRDMGCD